MNKVLKKSVFCVLIALILVATFAIVMFASIFLPVVCVDAHAEEEVVTEEQQEEAAPQVVIVEKEAEKDDLMEVFKNNILPYIVDAGMAVLAFLAVLAPYIKVRGKYNALQGAFAVSNKTLDHFKEQVKEITPDAITEKIKETIIPELKQFIIEAVKDAVKENVIDTTGDITKIQAQGELMSMQIGNLINAAIITWGDLPGIKELLTKSPTAETVVKLLAEVKDLKAQVEAQNGAQIEPINEVIKELEAYGNENE